MKLVPLLGLLLFSALPWPCAWADQATFQSGISAFQAGDPERARRLLEQARASGMNSSALYYNLGVVYFRLGLLDQAEAAFTSLLDSPHAPLARYNLGLVLQQQGDPEGANAWFRQAAGESSPEAIRALAQRQLINSDQPPLPETAPLRAVGLVSAVLGYDDNIAGTPSAAATDEAGPFGDWLASGRVYLDRDRGTSVRLDAVAYSRQHPGNTDFDSTYLGLGVAWQRSLAKADLATGVTLSRFWFGGDLLEQQARLDLAYDRPGCFGPTPVSMNCRLEGFASTFQGGPGFSAYDGRLYGVGAKIARTLGPWALNARVRLERDRRDDRQTATEFFSLSPSSQTLTFSAERRVSDRLSLGGEQRLRLSRYDDPHRLLGNGEILTVTREDDRFRTRLFAGYQLDRRWRLGAELAWEDNQSTLDRYGYHRTELLISLDGAF